ncbi:hypothetical protein HETIRDRAFT_378930 [Heterobasidion irregulare TC 32-1]|uniref:Vps72/YL1 C-terminal domain-containing protein n=1 Tax=Heterobasidion irregulare (strain TC 32-1) TaxID=747525 RepID=W4KQS7_HETIT|nr:uncharacterized protein HETIRDRAFT_378930 [Heterobasidion irregulare TC 32-1]ETW87755.1 hypothetical protein HETIRDRAFT_378930 [Heterobasidion irregulare TC 32-1]
MDQDDSLVRRRPRRSTAGNRMEAALAELALEDANQEAEEDNDFVIEKDEEDVFGSDFESTDDEAIQALDGGEYAVQYDEQKERRVARSRLERVTAAAHARQKVTFNPMAYEETPATEKLSALEKRKRRVSLGVAVDAETGKVIRNSKRQSQRTHTVANTSATFNRMMDAEEKKSTTPKKAKAKLRALNQEELIARALDMEEGNMIDHRDYLRNEEEKRKRAHVTRTVIEGPLLRWISKREELAVIVDPPAVSSDPGHHASQGQTLGDSLDSTLITNTSHAPYSSTGPSQSSASPFQPSISHATARPVSPLASSSSHSNLSKVETKETVAKNYVIHEIPRSKDGSKPSWRETMAAMFGDTVKWDELKVYTNKGRPLCRPVQNCLITGLPAKYLDPRTNVPYATVDAYIILTKILNHEFVWSRTLGCYVSNEFTNLQDTRREKRRRIDSTESAMDVDVH